MSDPLAALKAVSGNIDAGTTSSGLPSIPAVPNTDDSSVRNWMSAVKSWLEKAAGIGSNTGSLFVTKNEMVQAGVITQGANGEYLPARAPSMTIPPAPTGLTATGAMTNILLQWNDPNNAYGNHSHTEIWAAQTNNFSVATLVGESSGFMFAHSVGPATTRYYWIRFVSTSDVKGPFQATSGALGQTSNDPSFMLSVLTGQLTESQLYTSLNTRINLVDAPDTTSGSVAARIKTAQDTLQAQINALSLTPAYDSGHTYATNDIVQYSGSLYKAKSATTGNVPTNTTYWTKIGDYTSLADIVAANAASIDQINYVNAGSTSASAQALAALQATVTSNNSTLTSAINTEATTRASNDTTNANAISSLTSTVTNNYNTLNASIITEQNTRASNDTSIANSVTTLQSSVTGGGNLLTNTLISNTTSGWQIYSAVENPVTWFGVIPSGSNGAPAPYNAVAMVFNGNADGIYRSSINGLNIHIPVIPGQKIEAQALVEVFRAKCRLEINFQASDGSNVSFITASGGVSEAVGDTSYGKTASDFVKLWGFATTPAGAASAFIEIRAARTSSSYDSELHVAMPYLGYASDSQTKPSPWSPSSEGLLASVQTQATTIGGLSAQYTVKIDNNGYVTGYGLASTAVNGTPYSEFTIVADKFSIAPVATSPSATDGSPFFYLTSPTTINGVTVPAGAYMKDAYIANLHASKIVAGDIAADRIKSTVVSAINGSFDQINAVRINGTNLSVVNGSFSGSLQAATGTFAGDISAATGTFSGAVSGASVMAALANSTNYTYSSAGTYSLTIPTGLSADSIRIRIIGGAGGGGFAGTSVGGYRGGYGGNGGSGAIVDYTLSYASYAGSTFTIVVGQPGHGGVFNATSATQGGTSSVSGVGSAAGGYPGASGGTATPDSIGVGGDDVIAGSNGVDGANGGDGAGGAGGIPSIGSGAWGVSGYVLISIYKGDVLVKNTSYQALLNWLDTLGHGTVPAGAR